MLFWEGCDQPHREFLMKFRLEQLLYVYLYLAEHLTFLQWLRDRPIFDMFFRYFRFSLFFLSLHLQKQTDTLSIYPKLKLSLLQDIMWNIRQEGLPFSALLNIVILFLDQDLVLPFFLEDDNFFDQEILFFLSL